MAWHNHCDLWLGRRKHYLAYPRPQEADTHFAIVIQVGIQSPAALGEVAKERWHSRVDVGELDVKEEEAIFIGRACGAFYKC